jgi:hypothetical protein
VLEACRRLAAEIAGQPIVVDVRDPPLLLPGVRLMDASRPCALVELNRDSEIDFWAAWGRLSWYARRRRSTLALESAAPFARRPSPESKREA